MPPSSHLFPLSHSNPKLDPPLPSPPMPPSSLRDLLSEDGFSRRKPRRKHSQPLTPAAASVCTDRRSFHRAFFPNGSFSFNSNRTSSDSHNSVPKSLPPHRDEEEEEGAGMDEAAVRAVVSILSGYAGRFLKDAGFRRQLREKCAACLAARKGAAHAVLANLELGIESIERLAEEGPNSAARDSKIRSLRNSIRLLSIVASLNSPRSRSGGYTCGVPNPHLSACAQLYLAVVYKIERNDRVSARHLLQVFVDAPFLARKNLLPDLWDHFFLPHLLHLKVWYSREVELVAGWEVEDRDQRMKGLNRTFNDQMDVGTAQFALYYKEWLKVGGKAPPVPSVSLPLKASYLEPWGKRSVSFSRCSINRNLYQAVFGASLEQEDIDDGVLIGNMDLAVESELDAHQGSSKMGSTIHSDMGVRQKESDPAEAHQIARPAPVPRKSFSFRLFSCRSEPYKGAIHHAQVSKKDPVANARESFSNIAPPDLGQAITLISDSDSLGECEVAVRVVAKAWLDSHGDSILETAMSLSSMIEGLLEVAFTSKDDEVLELAISILAELVTRNEVNRHVVLNADPQLEIFLRLLRSNKHFLKAAVLLYLLKPRAKQMLSLDWIPLVLHVLDNGDQMQTLFTIRGSPNSAALYFLHQLLMGFDVDRNVENAKQMIALGGLDLLIKRLEMRDVRERKSCALLLATCVQADGSCRDYLAGNIKKASIIELLLGNQLKSKGSALSLLSELICLNRTTQIIRFLKELKNDGCFNTMHLLLVYLQQAPLEQRPLAAAILLLLDLLGDSLRSSVYREEGIDAIVAALERNLHHKNVQEQCSRALLLLGGRFSCLGETMAETWLLKRAGLDDGPSVSFRSQEILAVENSRADEEEKAIEEWLGKLSMVLLTSGNKRFLVALSNCIADGIPSLARSCLVTVAWMSSSLSSLHSANSLQPLACSILAPRLFESLSYDRALEERVLASLSLLNFVSHPECLPKLFPLDRETINSLQDLAQVTWTAKELLFACCRCS